MSTQEPMDADRAAEILTKLRRSLSDAISAIDALSSPQEQVLSDPLGVVPLEVAGRCTGITQHAIDRYRERTGTNKGALAIVKRIKERLTEAQEWRLKEKWRVVEMIAHGAHSKYFRHGDTFFVVEGGVIVTCHKGEADRWEPSPKEELANS